MDEGELADRENDVHYRATMRRIKDEASGRPSTERCIDCGEKIPKERIELMIELDMTCERCVRCQAAAERPV